MAVDTQSRKSSRLAPRDELSIRGPRPRSIAIGLLLVGAIVVAFSMLQRHFVSETETALDSHNVASASVPDMSVAAFDWPQWRGPNQDGVSREMRLLTDWPEQGLKTLWTKATTGTGYSGLSIAAGRLYTLMQDGDDEAVVCLNSATGEELWRFRYPASFVNDQGSGPRSTPTVDGDRVYTVGATGVMHCLSTATGERIWRHDLIKDLGGRIPDWGVSFSPLVDGDMVFTHPGGGADSSLAAFDKYTGELRWKSLDDRPGYGSPVTTTAAGVRQILFFTGEALVSVAPENGRLYWRHPWRTMMDCNVATPICDGDHVFISSGYGHGCALLKIVSKGSGAVGVDVVYEHDRMRNHFSTSVLYEDHLYGFDETRLVCMELMTGNVLWSARGFRKGSLIVADGHLIILGENGKLALAEATPAAYREKAAYRISRTRCWTVPTLVGGRLFVRSQEQITCLDLKTAQAEHVDANEIVAGRLPTAAQRNNEQ